MRLKIAGNRPLAIAMLALLASSSAFAQDAALPAAVVAPTIDKGDTAWMMTSTLLVLLMILPGLALFYGGLARTKNMLSVMTQVGGAAALAMLVWIGWGYSLSFGTPVSEALAPFIGGTDKLFLLGMTTASTAATFTPDVAIPEYVFVAFQMTFAAITVALILGAIVERIRFGAVLVFTLIWLTIVYAPIAHAVWATGGLFFEMKALDFAGGTVVHVNAGVSALVACLILGPRLGHQRDAMPPHSLTLTMVGTGLLWVGWFGFNAGSALEANAVAGLAMLNTFVATAAAGLVWMLVERLTGQHGSALGFCSGVVAGLVAVTPAAGNSGPLGAILLGAIASAICCLVVTRLKPRLRYDDTLDAFGIHGVGGIVGAIGTAVVYQPELGGPGDGSIPLGAQLVTQLLTVGGTILWAAIGTAIALGVTRLLVRPRPSPDAEREGLDLTDHGERAYNY